MTSSGREQLKAVSALIALDVVQLEISFDDRLTHLPDLFPVGLQVLEYLGKLVG